MSRQQEERREFIAHLMYAFTLLSGLLTALFSGNTAGGLMMLAICGLTFRLCIKILRVSDRVMCYVCTLIWLLGSFVFFGAEFRSSVYEKNGVQKQTPFLAIPFYDETHPASL